MKTKTVTYTRQQFIDSFMHHVNDDMPTIVNDYLLDVEMGVTDKILSDYVADVIVYRFPNMMRRIEDNVFEVEKVI